jgi:glycosyltransferase involved in cell wall biosynthesis
MTPSITVLMAVHNGEAFLEQALASVRHQTRPEFEFIVVDDASTDASASILASVASEDGRISVIRNARNLGLTRSLNVGLRAARGEYIARIDADDIAAPRRLEIQADFLARHSDHVLVGSRERVIDAEGRRKQLGRGGLEGAAFRYLSYFAPPIVHSSAMFRHATIQQHGLAYDEGCRTAQDFELWQRLLRFGEGCRLPDILVEVREHDRRISHKQNSKQADTAIAVSASALARDFRQVDAELLAQVAAFLVAGRVPPDAKLAGIIDTALDVEARFVGHSGADRRERKKIRALTVNRILKGAANSARALSTEMLSSLARLLGRRPMVVVREVILVAGRRTW